jgi:hypothetical protein
MNAYNQDKSLTPALARYKSSDGRDDPFKMLVRKYMSDVEETMTNILQKTKKMSAEQADKSVSDMLTLGEKRQKDIADEVEECYTRGKTLQQCAEELINK